MTTTDVESRTDDRRARSDDAHARLWLAVLLVGLVVAIPVLLHWGRAQWFFLDEWAFLVNRRLTAPSTMLAPHNGHWVTLPAVAYRLLFRAIGLRSYRPYQMAAVATHLAVVLMAWITMRRLHVRPAIATLTALPFVLYGSGRGNILFGFQIALTGSIVFGLAQLVLATRTRRTVGTDVAAVACGLAAIMCSAVGIPLVLGVTLAVLVCRGWRSAAVQAIPLGAIYVAWYVAYAAGESRNDYSLGSDTLSFVWRMTRTAFEGLGRYGVVALLLAAVATFGLVGVLRLLPTDRFDAAPAIALALVVSAGAFAALTAFGRAEAGGVQSASATRYIYVVAALLLPLVALGGELLARRWIVLGVVPVVLLVIGLPHNIDLLRRSDPITAGRPDLVTAIAHSALLDQLPAQTRILALPTVPTIAPTAGFLRRAARDGRLPDLPRPSPTLALEADGFVALHQTGRKPTRPCPTTAAATVHLDRGAHIEFSGVIAVGVRRGTASSSAFPFDAEHGRRLAVLAGPVDLTISGPLGQPAICRIVR